MSQKGVWVLTQSVGELLLLPCGSISSGLVLSIQRQSLWLSQYRSRQWLTPDASQDGKGVAVQLRPFSRAEPEEQARSRVFKQEAGQGQGGAWPPLSA